MTFCKLKIVDTNPDDTVLILRADGHATGFTEVCAAISSLVCMLRGYLHNDPEVRVSREVVREGDVNIIAAGGSPFVRLCSSMIFTTSSCSICTCFISSCDISKNAFASCG